MIKKQILVEVTEANSLQELSETEQKLVISAREIVKKAYAPYSGFSVGAAVLLENGEIITGNNQENSAYPYISRHIHVEHVDRYYSKPATERAKL